MSDDAGIDQLNGRSTGNTELAAGVVITDNQVLPWRPVKHYRKVTDSRDRNVARNSGTLGAAGDGGPEAGEEWDSPSTLDAITVDGEIYHVLYVEPGAPANDPGWTGMDMIIELFKDLRKRQAAGTA